MSTVTGVDRSAERGKGSIRIPGLRYARPEEYVSPLEYSETTLRPCSFDPDSPEGVPESDALLERAVRHWIAPGYMEDYRHAFVRFLGPDSDGSVLEVGCAAELGLTKVFDVPQSES